MLTRSSTPTRRIGRHKTTISWRGRSRLIGCGLVLTLAAPGTSRAEAVRLDEFVQLAKQCAPHVAPETLAAVARTESSFDPLAIHDNTTALDHHPATREAAIALATELAVVAHHSVDLGLMQINSANFPRLGLTVATAFDSCRSLASADQVLVAGYDASVSGDDQQALHRTLSRYNTGDPERGITNGYVAKVQASAALVVPAIQLQQATGETATEPSRSAQAPPPPPPAWDVYGQAKAAKGPGLVFGALRSSATPPRPAPSPLPSQATSEAMNYAR